MENLLPSIPAKRYFTIGEVSELCGVKPHVLRYWEQEFTQLRPMKRRGNRRYYQHHEVLMIRSIRELLYDQGFTIVGARNRLQEVAQSEREQRRDGDVLLEGMDMFEGSDSIFDALHEASYAVDFQESESKFISRSLCSETEQLQAVRRELHEIRDILSTGSEAKITAL